MTLRGLNEASYPSKYAIGDSIQITMPKSPAVDGWIRAIIFSNAKVRYSIFVEVDRDKKENGMTTLHNIDSVFISDGFKKPMDTTEFDNYS